MSIRIRGSKMKIPRSKGRVRTKARLRKFVILGTLWAICGDSQTEGRAPAGTCQNPGNAFRLIINENEGTNITTFTNLGLGGSVLSETNARYLASSARSTRTWVHTQESGNQSGGSDSQINAAAFKATFKDHCRDVAQESPDAEQSYETPFSFGRQGEANRNWDEEYENALRSAIEELKEEGIIVHLAEVRRNIEALETFNEGGITISSSDVWYTDTQDSKYAHYTPLGNLMVALSKLVALGRNPLTYKYTSITDVTADQKTACLAVIRRFGASDGIL